MEQKLNGSKFIKRTVRPPRIAFVIKTLADVEKFISIASLSWGGRYFLAIPCSEEGTINEEWFDVIKKYNPDSINTFHQLSDTTEERLWRSKFAIHKITKHTEIRIEHLYSEKHIPEFFGQPIINFFLLDNFYDLDKGKAHLSYISTDSNIDLYFKARFGVIDNNEWLRWQHIYINPQHRKNHPNEIIENAPFSFEQDILSYLHQNRHKDNNNEFISILDYTISHLAQIYIDRFLEDQPKSETSHIVIVSKEENAEEFCWFWAIRGQRYNPHDNYSKGPIWISQQVFTSKLDLLQNLFVNRKNIYVLSKSVSEEELPALSEGWFFQRDNFQEFYNDHYYIGDTMDIPVNFVDNKTEYKFDSPDSLKFLNSSHNQQQYSMLDIQIPEIVLPRVRDFSFDNLFFNNYWVTKSGLTRIIRWNKDEIIKLTIPNPWEVISTFADVAGYRTELSDKGRIGNELVKLINGEKYIWLMSHPAVLNLLLEMSNVNKVNNIRKLVRDNVKNEDVKNQIINSLPRKSLARNNLLYSAIKAKLKMEFNGEKLDDRSSVAIIEWLLDKDILRQGKTIKCNLCSTENWIPVNDFKSKLICSGCTNEIKNPFGIDKIDWEYEINTLVSSEIDQGLLIHLLTGYYIIDQANANFYKKNVYSAYYGVNFIKNNRPNEIDIVFTVEGHLTIGECKISGREFTENIIKESINFAKEINALKLIFSCLEHVEELIDKLKDIKLDGIELTILGKDDLHYQFPGLAHEKQFMEKSGKAQPMNSHEKYKQSLNVLKDQYEYDI